MTLAKVSVVIPFYNGGELGARCLRSVLNQNYPAEHLEIIAVDDGSSDKTNEILEKEVHEHLNLKIVRQPNRGPASARTVGVKMATGEYVFILSQDCLAEPDWLKKVANIFENRPKVGIVQGRILPTRPIDLPIYHCMAVKSFSFSFETAAIAYRTEALDKAGRHFDEVFSVAGQGAYGDDTDLAWRILEAGYESFWLDEVTAKHEVLPRSFWKDVRDAKRLPLFNLLVKRHPGLRAHLRWGILWGDPRRYLRLATLFLAVLGSFLYLGGLTNWHLASGIWLLFLVTNFYYGWKDSQDNRCPWYYKLTLLPAHKLLTELLATLSFWYGSFKYRCALV
ncbi:MAG: glycosyltransferase family A protein [bacterium]|nr:glycosyltransferase family A protein [bacterium]